MRSRILLTALLLVVSSVSYAQKSSKAVDPDIMPALPEGPPPKASKAEIAKSRAELKSACVVSLKKNEGLVPELKLKDKSKVAAVCECVAREMSKGGNLEELDFVATFYKGFDNKIDGESSNAIYLHEADKLEENCRIDSNYKVGQPEPRERSVNSVPEAKSKKSK